MVVPTFKTMTTKKIAHNADRVNNLWLKAAVVGGFWASVEIIIGSFLHNLRIPFASPILASVGVLIMVSFHRLWNERGIIWRAGLLCALMKCISPSAVIMGPMIGIMSQALLMELSIAVFKGSFPGYFLGGILALLSSIAQKIIGILFLYGLNALELYKNMYYFAVRQFNVQNSNPWHLILAVIVIYAALGFLAALVGFLAGKKSNASPKQDTYPSPDYDRLNGDIFKLDSNQRFSLKFLFVHIFAIPAGLLIINNFYFYLAALVLIIYAIFTLIYYKKIISRLKKPLFLIQIVIIMILAVLFLGTLSESSDTNNIKAFYIGLEMNIRAIFIFIAFSALSVELRNPVVENFLFRHGFARLYISMRLAFSALPGILSGMASPRKLFKSPGSFISYTLSEGKELFIRFKQIQSSMPRVVIITADKNKGKTTYAMNLAEDLKAQGKKVGGFLAIAVNKNGGRSGFTLREIESGKEHNICTINETSGWQKVGRYYVNPGGIDFGRKILNRNIAEDPDWIVIDEVGHMEMGNRGWAPFIDQFMQSKKISGMVWVVRKTLVARIIKKWPHYNYTVINIDDKISPAAAAEMFLL